MIFVSDGSMANGQGTSGYKIVDPMEPTLFIMASAPCDSHPECIQSYRAELNGILGEIILSGEILRYYGKTGPTSTITTYCDNISALAKLEEKDVTPGIRSTLGPDYDLANEIAQAIDKYGLVVQPTHVKGHQDATKRYEDLPFPAQMNCDCDEAAGAHMRCPPPGLAPRTSAPFFPSSKAALLIDGSVITSNRDHHIRMKREGTSLRNRIMSKEGWTLAIFNTVDWKSMEIALKKLGRSRFATRVIQFQHRWLPLGRQQHRIHSEQSNLCPICKGTEETQTHFLTCNDERCRANVLVQMAMLHKELQKKK